MNEENKIVQVYVLKGLNGISLVVGHQRVSDKKIYGLLTPIYTFDVLTDDILQAIGHEKRNVSKWIDGYCANCGCDTPAYIIDWKWKKDMKAKYCPQCGSYMRGDENG